MSTLQSDHRGVQKVRILVQYVQLRFVNLVSQCFNNNTYAEYVDNIAYYCLDLEIIQYVAFTDKNTRL